MTAAAGEIPAAVDGETRPPCNAPDCDRVEGHPGFHLQRCRWKYGCSQQLGHRGRHMSSVRPLVAQGWAVASSSSSLPESPAAPPIPPTAAPQDPRTSELSPSVYEALAAELGVSVPVAEIAAERAVWLGETLARIRALAEQMHDLEEHETSKALRDAVIRTAERLTDLVTRP